MIYDFSRQILFIRAYESNVLHVKSYRSVFFLDVFISFRSISKYYQTIWKLIRLIVRLIHENSWLPSSVGHDIHIRPRTVPDHKFRSNDRKNWWNRSDPITGSVRAVPVIGSDLFSQILRSDHNLSTRSYQIQVLLPKTEQWLLNTEVLVPKTEQIFRTDPWSDLICWNSSDQILRSDLNCSNRSDAIRDRFE